MRKVVLSLSQIWSLLWNNGKIFGCSWKLKKKLIGISLDDHLWSLKSWDQNGIGIVKLLCGKCCKEFGGLVDDHSKSSINNLFGNFKKSHKCHLCMFKIGVEEKVWTFLPILNLLFLRGKPFFSQMKIRKGMLKKA